ncbi:uracil permease-like protein [Coleophoma cylindrospora]|uniref:Uracil permease-like protein n=1 Tax=Coleophoma cylindrospora TaxID=1849047 RepID=A0A3D8RC52_9HELO|nr:uracil permease-like protein [Coleophoma cylindrospora]
METPSTWKESAVEKWRNFRFALTSKQAFLDWVQVPPFLDEDGKINEWRNEDLSPTPPEKRTWSWFNWVVFYFSSGFGNWTLGSTMVGIGLNWWQAIIAIFLSQMISSTAMYFNGRCGITYHIGYPCVARSVFGMWGSYYYVAARAALALIWYGVQLYSCAALLDNMFRAIFGHSYTQIPNHIPLSEGITSRRMMCFFLAWLAHLCLARLRPNQLTKFFWAKLIVLVPAMIGLFIFCIANTNGNVGPLYSPVAGDKLGWLVMFGINSGMGNSATYITNQPDMVRWSKKKNGAQWSQLIVNPITVTVSSTLGILATASINNKWGLDLWNQWDLLSAILDRYWSPGPRFAIALCAFCWTFYFMGINIGGNMLPFGSDCTMLFPRYLTIPRGNYLVTFAAFAIVPWKIEASAAIFTKFLSGYGLFMASVASIMICEYFFLTKGNVFISHLYDGSKANKHYYYHKGWNVQATIAYVIGISLPFPGFVGTLGPNVSATATHIFEFGWLLSFWTSFIVYYLICWVWPTRNQRLIKEMGLGWEQMAEELDVIDGTVISGESSSENGVELGKEGVVIQEKSGDQISKEVI